MIQKRSTENAAGNCPLCGRPRNFVFALAHSVVWQCTSSDCGLQFADPQPSEEALERAYTDLYYPPEGAGEVKFENTDDDTFRQAFRKIQARLGDLRGLRLLDYGCGRGALLRIAREFGMQPTGIETDSLACAAAAKIPGASAYAGLAELRASEPDARFDLIILWTVIEHLRNPWDELAHLRAILRPEGSLLIFTMDIHCLRARLERQKWESYENRTHLFYFDPKSLQRAAREAGFSESIHWRLKLRHPHHGIIRRWLYHITFALRLADGLYILCRATSQRVRERSIEPIAAAEVSSDVHEAVAMSRLNAGRLGND